MGSPPSSPPTSREQEERTELSTSRVKDLEQFIRECEAFKMDHGHRGEGWGSGDELEKELERLRGRFEELLGNASG